MVSYWIDTLVLKNRGKYWRCFAASPFPLQGKTNACSRGSKKDFWRRCQGDLRQVKTYLVPITTLILRITSFAISLSFSSPPLHPCHFICPLFLSPSLSVRFFFACLLVCWIACLSRWLKIILNYVTFPIPTIMTLLALRLLLLPLLNLVKLILLCYITLSSSRENQRMLKR